MRKLVVALFLAGFACYANAAAVYGAVTSSGRPVANVGIEITCAGRVFSATTNAQGSYRVNVAATGECTFSVIGRPGAAITVYSYSDPVRYNFELSGGGNSYSLRRVQ